METIATLLKFIAFCIKSWQPLERYGWHLKNFYLKSTNNDKYDTLLNAFVLLISIPSEISILLYSSIYTSYKHSSK